MGQEERALSRELKLNQLYLAIISRYKEYIEEKEHISVAELPTLVTPKNHKVAKMTDEIKSTFGMFSYKSHFYEASINAFYYVNDEIEDVAMPLQFWLTPEDTLNFGVGDLLDRNVLLCSLLISLGNPSAKVFVYIEGGTRKVFTYYEFEGKAYSLEFGRGFKMHNNREGMIKSFKIGDETTAYEFNDKMYVEIS